MKTKLSCCLFLLFFGVCNAQMEPAVLVLKSGEKLNVIGKLKSHTFKYKENEESKAKEIEFSEIETVKKLELNKTYKFFALTDDSQIIAVEQLSYGGKVELYGVSFNTPNMAGGSINGTATGGMSYGNSATNYYLKKAGDKKLTAMGSYSPLMNNLREKVMQYFSDCQPLVEKIKNGDLRVREGLEKIVVFYNSSCSSQ